MSLARLALRLATVQAIKGRTLAGPHVSDSEQGPIDEIANDKRQPSIAVYTDDGNHKGGIAPRDLFGGEGSDALVFEIVISDLMEVKTDAGSALVWEMPATDAGREISLDLIARQIVVALADPANEWAEFWRQLVTSIGERKTLRGAAGKDGMRFSGKQLTWEVSLLRDPVPGQQPSLIWQRFVDLLGATPELAPQAAMIRSVMVGSIASDDVAALQETLVLSAPESHALLLDAALPPTSAN